MGCRKQKSHDTNVLGRSDETKKKVIIYFLSTLNQELLQINTVPWITQLPYVKDFFQSQQFYSGDYVLAVAHNFATLREQQCSALMPNNTAASK